MKTVEKKQSKAVELTGTQRLAVTKTGTNVLVSAGAGTGKTRVLVERFLHFVTSQKAMVSEVLALTYTEKAANEMKSRIMNRLTEMGRDRERRELESAYISTIHAFCARILREHPLEAGVDPDFRVIEEDESDYLQQLSVDEAFDRLCVKGSDVFELIRLYGEANIRKGLSSVLNAARHEGKYITDFIKQIPDSPHCDTPVELFERLGEKELAAAFERFSKIKSWDWKTVSEFSGWRGTFSRRRDKKGDDSWKTAKARCDDFRAFKMEELVRPWKEGFESLAKHFEEFYERRKRERGYLDFDDLQMKTLELFKKESPIHVKLRERYREKFRAILVDEFQDTNRMQLELIETMKSGNNLFFVGDFKQSVYKFRGAEPGLFLRLEAEYGDRKNGTRVSMVENFRSSGTVIDFVNGFFERLWEEDGLPFERLAAKAEEVKKSEVELMVVRLGEDEDMDHARMREADAIAERILELHEQGTSFGDMAVLFQAVKEIGIYEQALKKRNIPFFTLSGRGFYYQHEIRDMMSYLAFLENPLSDIPLAAALRSPLFQVSNDALFWLSYDAKSKDKEGKPTPLYDGVKRFENNENLPEDQKEKIRFFTEITEDLLKIKDQLKLTELIDLILSKTSYEMTALADPQGTRKYANLKKLMNLAREFERFEPLGLGDFLRMISRLEVQEARESEAQIEAEKSGRVVRMLSIHRSKGLEFPVVFAGDLGRTRRSSDHARVLAEPGLGYALTVWNPVDAEWEKPSSWLGIEKTSERKDREEWKRLLYVAATRARTRLIFSGVYKEKKKEKETFLEMSSWMDWMMRLIPDFETVGVSEIPGRFPLKRKHVVAETEAFHKAFPDLQPQALEKLIPSKSEREEAKASADTIFEHFKAVQPVPSRSIDLPVSAYAAFRQSPDKYRKVYEIGYRDDEFDARPGVDKDDVPAADFGTAMHWILEHLNFENPGYGLDNLIYQAMRPFGKAAVKRARTLLDAFLKSLLFRAIAQAKTVKKELPFLLNERHGIVHGIIDALYEDAQGRLHVVDYKTGEGNVQKVEKMGYDKQIEIYAHAVFTITGKMPDSVVLYFMDNGWEWRQKADSKWMETAANNLKSDQEKILEVRNRSIVEARSE